MTVVLRLIIFGMVIRVLIRLRISHLELVHPRLGYSIDGRNLEVPSILGKVAQGFDVLGLVHLHYQIIRYCTTGYEGK
jgi:hypothetical protein